MFRKRIINYCLGLVITLVTISCEQVVDFYIGIPLQPQFTIDNYHEGLNIFGILRTDSVGVFNKSFVYIETVQKATEFINFSRLDSVDVKIIRLNNSQVTDSFNFIFYNPDFVFSDSLYRPEILFRPKPGEKYRIICKYQDLPDATGESVIPSIPEIEQGSLFVTTDQVSFNIVSDSTIKLIDIYLAGNGQSNFIGRFVPEDGQNTVINFDAGSDLSGYKIIVYGYDANMAAYYSNSNTSLNFNKYRTTYSTLISGFGVFGSMNFTTIEF